MLARILIYIQSTTVYNYIITHCPNQLCEINLYTLINGWITTNTSDTMCNNVNPGDAN